METTDQKVSRGFPDLAHMNNRVYVDEGSLPKRSLAQALISDRAGLRRMPVSDRAGLSRRPAPRRRLKTACAGLLLCTQDHITQA